MFGFKKSMVQLVIFLAWATQYLTFESSALCYIFTTALTITTVLTFLTYDHDYWKSKGVFVPPAWPLVGHIASVVMFKEQGGMCFKRIYDRYKDKKFLGIHQFFQRTLVIQDPELIKRVCVNDFHHFMDRGWFYNKDVDPLAQSLLFMRGNEWKKFRARVSPIFSPNKLRYMLQLVENTANKFVERVKSRARKEYKNKSNIIKANNVEEFEANNNLPELLAVVNAEKLLGGFTADAIVPCAFGVKSNVMDNENDPFAVSLKAFYEMSIFNIFEKTMRQFWPAFVLFFRMRIIKKKTHDFFYNIVTSVLRDREKDGLEKRHDFIDMMVSLRNDKSYKRTGEDDIEITDMLISANAFVILLGGFETTSSILAFLFLELAAHPEIQEKMRTEVREVLEKYDDKVSQETLQDLTYMEMVLQETLRLYPPFPNPQRMCTKDWIIPDSNIVVEKGTIVMFPSLGIQRDEKYFENANAFVPERWAEGRPQPPPGVYIPFGDGPRYCIGKRFAMMQMKCCLVRLLPHVRISPVSDEPRIEPFAADPRSPLSLHPIDSRIKLTLL